MAAATDLCNFINASPSPFHAVAECERRLAAAGFERRSERDAAWEVKPGGKYYVTRNQSAIVAFAVGGKYKPGNGFSIAAAHSDSPCLRVKPVSTLSKAGYLSIGVETYGGGIWATWFDRDLSVAGRVIVARPDGSGHDSKLVRIDRPICRVPTLAIHLDRTVNEAWKVNTESHLPPVLATAVKAKLEEPAPSDAAAAAAAAAPGTGGAGTRHHSGLVRLLAEELGCAPEAVKDFELCLYDTQAAAIGGLYKEFVYSPRLDNLCMTYCVTQGLIDSLSPSAGAGGASSGGGAGKEASTSAPAVPLAEDPNVRIIASFDHEEVGSASVPGAGSNMLEDVITRLTASPALVPAAIRKSFLVSADMAHAVHPNYSGLHEENHRPAMHGGVVIKNNANQRYATSAVTAFLFRQLALGAGVPLQNFCVRQDMGCGSTIGPIVATRLGLRTVDCGVPQLSMHSVREMCGTEDVAHAVTFFAHFFGAFPAEDEKLAGTE